MSRKMDLSYERYLRRNEIDEEYDFHHVRVKLSNTYPSKWLEKDVNTNFAIAIPKDLHEMYVKGSKYVPKDVAFFYHQFMILQILLQLYDGFDELFEYMITYDNFDSYNRDYRYWKQNEK